jgi:hypothetical protein
VAGVGFGADVDLPADPLTIGTSQKDIPLLHNDQLLITEEVTKCKKNTRYMD